MTAGDSWGEWWIVVHRLDCLILASLQVAVRVMFAGTRVENGVSGGRIERWALDTVACDSSINPKLLTYYPTLLSVNSPHL